MIPAPWQPGQTPAAVNLIQAQHLDQAGPWLNKADWIQPGPMEDRLWVNGMAFRLRHGQKAPGDATPWLADHSLLDAWILARSRRQPPQSLEDLPLLLGTEPAPAFPRCPKRLGFYPVVPNSHWLEKLLKLGVRTLQLRVKELSGEALRQELARAVSLGEDHGARVFINDHWQLAMELGAYGVHLGQEDIQSANLAAIAQAGLRLGISTHGYFELLRAEVLQPSYIAMGAIFPTTTKVMPTAPQGLDKLAHYCRLVPHRPKVAIGGIDLTNADAVLGCGPDSLAVVRAVTESPRLEADVKAFLKLCGVGG